MMLVLLVLLLLLLVLLLMLLVLLLLLLLLLLQLLLSLLDQGAPSLRIYHAATTVGHQTPSQRFLRFFVHYLSYPTGLARHGTARHGTAKAMQGGQVQSNVFIHPSTHRSIQRSPDIIAVAPYWRITTQ